MRRESDNASRQPMEKGRPISAEAKILQQVNRDRETFMA